MKNDLLDILITNLEQAKDYFYAMGCSQPDNTWGINS